MEDLSVRHADVRANIYEGLKNCTLPTFHKEDY